MKTNLLPEDRGKVGVYLLHNSETGECYVGSGILDKRAKAHGRALSAGKHHNYKLQHAYNRNPNFDFVAVPVDEVELSVCENRILALAIEQEIVDEYYGNQLLLNIAQVVENPSTGTKHTEEHKKKIGEKSAEYWSTASPENIAKRNAAISEAKTKYWASLSCEERAAFCQAASERECGKVMPQEVKEKISTTLTGRCFTEEHKSKISIALTGMSKAPDAITKGVETRMLNGSYKHSEESKAKVSKPITINGTTYVSQVAAAAALGVSRSKVVKMAD